MGGRIALEWTGIGCDQGKLMALRLDNFKQAIPSHILTRGRDYYRKGRVVDLSQDDEDVWIAEVQGTDRYEVILEQSPDGSLNASCTCPYDDDYCKHVAAVLYAIEEAFPDAKPGTAKKRKAKPPRQSKRDKLKAALMNTSHEKLVDILLALADGNRELSNHLHLSLGLTGDSPSNYTRMVKDALRAGKGEYGYIDYYGAGRAARKIHELLEQANRMIEDRRIEPATALYQAILEHVGEAVGESDDSNGELADCVNAALEGLDQCASLVNPANRFALFEYFLTQAQGKIFQGWDWRWDLFALAGKLVQTREERAILFDALDSIKPYHASDDFFVMVPGLDRAEPSRLFESFEREQADLIKLEVIRRLDGEAAATAFNEAHLHLHGFRQRTIEQHLERGEVERAKQLAEEGVTLSQNERLPGLTYQYQAVLLTVAIAQADTPSIVPLARALWKVQGDDTYYALIKETTPRAEWPAMLEALIRDASPRPELVAHVYAKEGLWDRLLQLATTNNPYRMALVQHYRHDLEKRFPDEIARIYEQEIDRLMAYASNRQQYQKVAEYLQAMQSFGHAQRASAIAADLRARYPKRRAMLDELARI